MPKLKPLPKLKLCPKKFRQKWGYWDAPQFLRKAPKNHRDDGWGGGGHRISVWDKDGGHHCYFGFPDEGYTPSYSESAGWIKAFLKELNKAKHRLGAAKVQAYLDGMRAHAK